MKQPNYGNWISKNIMLAGWSATALLLLISIACAVLWKHPVPTAICFLLFGICAIYCIYMQICRHAFSFSGGQVMQKIHSFVLEKLPWDGNGTLLDIGCGSGALTIRCARTFPKAKITGVDYWGAEWNYAKAQCEENERLEGCSGIRFLKGDAAALPFEDESFDAAVSNFVFHEVKTAPDKRQVIREALRVVKKGGSFAFHDLFSQTSIYGDMDRFVAELKKEGISEIHYEAHTERLPFIPGYAKAPWLLSGLGILYGRK